jgi:hypothetical protein
MLFVKDAKYLEDYKIQVKFTDEKIGIVDLKDELYGTVFEPLKNKKLFSTVKFDEELDTISWDNGADLAPEFLYFKSFQNEPKLQNQFQQWGYI